MAGEALPGTYFNPRSLAGATMVALCCSIMPPFQSTLPCGSDRHMDIHRLYRLDFNPRSLAGATVLPHVAEPESKDFNPRSLTGATLKGGRAIVFEAFQSTLPRGSD